MYTLTALLDDHLASGSEDKGVEIWDLATGAKVRTLDDHVGGVGALAALPNG
jgi:WD40 repeat protein